VQIGDELDIHHELLEETDAAMDRTAGRLNNARRRLDHVAENAKQYGECWSRVGEVYALCGI
jgi:syntaxin 8